MMEFKEFCEEIRESVRAHLPENYQDAEIVLQENIKASDVHLTGLIIRNDKESISPCIYLEEFYQAYQEGLLLMRSFGRSVTYGRKAQSVRMM